MSWEKLQQLGRAGSIDELNALFAGGAAPNGLEGPTEGMLVERPPSGQAALARLLHQAERS